MPAKASCEVKTRTVHQPQKNGDIYVIERKCQYDPEKKYNIPEWVVIGRQVDGMPGLMIPNDNYEQIFCRSAFTS